MDPVSPPAGSTQAAVNSVAMQVNPDNVLQARAALLDEAERFHTFVMTAHRGGRPLIGLCGGDPVSRQAQIAFSAKIEENAIKPALLYVQELINGAKQLAEVARSFGFTEAQISASFKAGTQGVDPR